MTPLDLQVNILQLNNAAKSYRIQKYGNINDNFHYKTVTVKKGIEGTKQVQDVDIVPPIIPFLRQERQFYKKKLPNGDYEKMLHNYKEYRDKKRTIYDKIIEFYEVKGTIVDILNI